LTLALDERTCDHDDECSDDRSSVCMNGRCEAPLATTTIPTTSDATDDTTGDTSSSTSSQSTGTTSSTTSGTTGSTSGTGTEDGSSTGGPDGSSTGLECPRSLLIHPIVPTVILLIDQSLSMRDPFESSTRWSTLQNALMDASDGIVPTLQGEVRFGISFYTSFNGSAGGECPLLEEVAPSITNYDAIQELYDRMSPQHQTPTGDSISAITQTLLADTFPGPKAIVLATDGEPDTCEMPDPNLGQGESIAAAQYAFSMDIPTFVISVGNDISLQHLQDLANAGAGLPVDLPDDGGSSSGSSSGDGSETGSSSTGDLLAEASSSTGTGGEADTDASSSSGVGSSSESGDETGGGEMNAKYYVPEDRDALAAAFREIVTDIRPCTYLLEDPIEGGGANTRITLNGDVIPFGYADGWQIRSPNEIELVGAACQAALAGPVEITAEIVCGAD